MADRKIETVVDEQVARRLAAKAAFLNETLDARMRQQLLDWLGNWGLEFAVHVVKPKESLSSIARDYYGDLSKAAVIAAYNDITDPNVISVGQVLRLPEAKSKSPLPKGESPYLFGIHDRGGESLMAAAGRRGWVLVTESLGSNPNDWGSSSYADLADSGYGVIVRLNHGYSPNGTLPYSSRYADFAVRCANFVERSSGCHIWVIGNEPNLAVERPGGAANGEIITPQKYSQAYLACRAAIKSRSGHQNDQVVMAAIGPWNIQTIYPENRGGDWVVYFRQVLDLISGKVDGIAIHTYARDGNPANLASEARMGVPYHARRSMFRTYQDFMEAIPAESRHLPVYLTETNQNIAWEDVNRGWIRQAYAEINAWNADASHQKIRAMILYRWEQHSGDIWSFAKKTQVVADYRAALQNDYRWYR
ncbi:MAG: LysM peptidoglycan-binding domain-containing protein [Chloroflexi bacterium]|nr:LysM peptidoglycan-binding domain-containing protein [Chloroflexota bacterium]